MNFQEEKCEWSSPQAARRMADRIHADVKGMVATSRLVRRSEGIALVETNDLRIGRLLGKGAFSEVHEVQWKGETEQRYAVKHLKSKLMAQPENFRLAAGELAVEAHMLASFDHPNILKIRGWAANGVASFTQGRHDSFFLLLDCLDETLDQRISDWQKQSPFLHSVHPPVQAPVSQGLVADLWRRFSQSHVLETASTSTSLSMREASQQHQREQLYLQKLGIMSEIAAGLNYLHENGVIFRDLKPNNIGFLNGRVQLFDFGLSRELPEADLTQPFEMSGKVGTLRYMAVEVASHQSYNVAADVYSWAMVCYEILTLQKPFAGWTRDMHANLVCGRAIRPDIRHLPSPIITMLELCWHQQPQRRPSMAVVKHKMQMLEEEQLLSLSAILSIQDESLRSNSPSSSSSAMVVELPHDFDVLKPSAPGRTTSETFTNSTALSISAESLRDFF